jgi:hypothetical protein
MDLESNDHRVSTGKASGESTALNTPVDRPSEKKEEEDEETVASPVAAAAPTDDFPDGGLAAWGVVVGVSQIAPHFVVLFIFF